jgi:hypothetical protein
MQNLKAPRANLVVASSWGFDQARGLQVALRPSYTVGKDWLLATWEQLRTLFLRQVKLLSQSSEGLLVCVFLTIAQMDEKRKHYSLKIRYRHLKMSPVVSLPSNATDHLPLPK